MAEKITTMLSGLYYFYRNGALNRTNLKNAYTCLGMKVLLPTQAGCTRWVSHVYKTSVHFLNGYKAFWLHLEQLASSNEGAKIKPKVQGFLKLMKYYNVIPMTIHARCILCTQESVFEIPRGKCSSGRSWSKHLDQHWSAKCYEIKRWAILVQNKGIWNYWCTLQSFNIKVTG